MSEIIIAPCPKCGRKPKIKVTHGKTGVWCTIQCNPFLRKPHGEPITYGTALEERAVELAVNEWNRRADCANLPVW